jgi:uncharacterized protein YaiE (UPF0345 family)
MPHSIPEKFANVTVACKSNIYFDGKVVSRTVTLDDGTRKTLGLIYPGTYSFNTEAPERMELVAGNCRVSIAGGARVDYPAGTFFDIPGKSSFEITVDAGIAEYICSFG